MFLGSSYKARLTLILGPFQHGVVQVLEKESMGYWNEKLPCSWLFPFCYFSS